jgi:hypothetical protein
VDKHLDGTGEGNGGMELSEKMRSKFAKSAIFWKLEMQKRSLLTPILACMTICRKSYSK